MYNGGPYGQQQHTGSPDGTPPPHGVQMMPAMRPAQSASPPPAYLAQGQMAGGMQHAHAAAAMHKPSNLGPRGMVPAQGTVNMMPAQGQGGVSMMPAQGAGGAGMVPAQGTGAVSMMPALGAQSKVSMMPAQGTVNMMPAQSAGGVSMMPAQGQHQAHHHHAPQASHVAMMPAQGQGAVSQPSSHVSMMPAQGQPGPAQQQQQQQQQHVNMLPAQVQQTQQQAGPPPQASHVPMMPAQGQTAGAAQPMNMMPAQGLGPPGSVKMMPALGLSPPPPSQQQQQQQAGGAGAPAPPSGTPADRGAVPGPAQGTAGARPLTPPMPCPGPGSASASAGMSGPGATGSGAAGPGGAAPKAPHLLLPLRVKQAAPPTGAQQAAAAIQQLQQQGKLLPNQLAALLQSQGGAQSALGNAISQLQRAGIIGGGPGMEAGGAFGGGPRPPGLATAIRPMGMAPPPPPKRRYPLDDERKVLPRRGMDCAMRAAGLEPKFRLDASAEAALEELYDDIISNVLSFGCSNAKRRQGASLKPRDMAVYLERTWHVYVPGFTGDQHRPYRRAVASELHKARTRAARQMAVAVDAGADAKDGKEGKEGKEGKGGDGKDKAAKDGADGAAEKKDGAAQTAGKAAALAAT